MSSPLATEETTTALDVLAKPQRRYLLATLVDREDVTTLDSSSPSASMSVTALATEIATTKHDCPIVTDEQCEQIHVSLVHSHIPRLVDIDVLTENDGDGPTVSLAEHSMFEAEWVRTLLDDPTGESFAVDEPTLNRTLEALRKPRRRTVCAVLARRRDPVSISDLAAAVIARDSDEKTRLIDVTEADCTSVATALAHEHLPVLSDAGLVAYDDPANGVELATDAPQWRADWMPAGVQSDVTDLVQPGPERQGQNGPSARKKPADDTASDGGREWDDHGTNICRTIQGVEETYARAHEIADSADEELVVTVPDGDRIRQECLRRWHDAAERGVDVYIGSHSPRVRDTVRSAIPDATVCEPQLDWLNLPIEQGNHGHIVFADREIAMIVTTEEANSGEKSRVGAITGHGRQNALVSLMCIHIGPRLDRLADESDARNGTLLQM